MHLVSHGDITGPCPSCKGGGKSDLVIAEDGWRIAAGSSAKRLCPEEYLTKPGTGRTGQSHEGLNQPVESLQVHPF